MVRYLANAVKYRIIFEKIYFNFGKICEKYEKYIFKIFIKIKCFYIQKIQILLSFLRAHCLAIVL